jgi:hypothetical protein
MWKLGLRRTIPRKGIHKWDFRCSVLAGVRLASVFHWGNLLPAVTLITDETTVK